MISTVTTTTTTTTTTVTTVAGSSLISDIGLLAVISLIVLLIVKELAGAAVDSGGELQGYSTLAAVDKVSNVGIVPLLFVFAFIVVQKIVTILG
jgi:archaellum biogenesis protein FlaJ (TadC family)